MSYTWMTGILDEDLYLVFNSLTTLNLGSLRNSLVYHLRDVWKRDQTVNVSNNIDPNRQLLFSILEISLKIKCITYTYNNFLLFLMLNSDYQFFSYIVVSVSWLKRFFIFDICKYPLLIGFLFTRFLCLTNLF